MSFLAWFLAKPARLLAAGAALAIGILLVRIQLLERARDRAEAQARKERLGRRNAEARADTTRTIFQDSLAGRTRLVEQLQVESHARLQAKNREAMARADLELRFDSLVAVVHAPTTEDSAGVRSTEFMLDSVPLHMRALVQVPAPPSPARWDVAAWLDPARLTLELACEKDVARADLVGPPWLKVQLDRIQQDPRICSPPVQTRLKAHRLGFGAGVGLGVIRNGSGVQAGPGVFAGVTIRF